MPSRSEPESRAVYGITAVAESAGDDLRRRQRRYIWSMAARVAMFPAAFLFHGVLRWVALVFALVTPAVAVVLANTAGQRSSGPPPATPDFSAPAITDTRLPPDESDPDAAFSDRRFTSPPPPEPGSRSRGGPD